MSESRKLEVLLDLKTMNQVFCFSDDDKFLLSVQDEQLIILEIESKTQIGNIQFPKEVTINQHIKICVSSDMKYCCVSSSSIKNGSQIYILCRFNLQEKRLVDFIENFHLMPVEFLGFIPNTHILYSIGRDQIRKFLDMNQIQPKSFLVGFKQITVQITFIQKNRRFFLVDNFSNFKLIDFELNKELKKFQLRQGNCYSARIIQEGFIAILRSSSRQFVFSTIKGKLIRKFKPDFHSNFTIFSDDKIFYFQKDKIVILNIDTANKKIVTVYIPFGTNYIKLMNKNSFILDSSKQIQYLPNVV